MDESCNSKCQEKCCEEVPGILYDRAFTNLQYKNETQEDPKMCVVELKDRDRRLEKEMEEEIVWLSTVKTFCRGPLKTRKMKEKNHY